MDCTLLNLTSLLLASAGVFAVLTEYSVRELRSSYYGQNPFLIKAEKIKSASNGLFIGVAVIAALLQACTEVFGDRIPERTHPLQTYMLYFVLGVGFDVVLVRLLARIGKAMARRMWLPAVIRSQREVFKQAAAIIRNNGWRDDQLEIRDRVSEPSRLLEANWQTVRRSLSQLESLLELSKSRETLAIRLERLTPYFSAFEKRKPAR